MSNEMKSNKAQLSTLPQRILFDARIVLEQVLNILLACTKVVNDHAKIHHMTQERSCKNDPPGWFGTLLVFARNNLDALHGNNR